MIRKRLALVSIAWLVGACQPAASPPETTVPPTTSNPTVVTTTAPDVEVPSALVFDEVDTGVATAIRLLDPEPVQTLEEAPSDPGGDRFELVACTITWFGNHQFEFDWEPGPGSPEETSRQIAVAFGVGDTGVLGGYFEVDLSGPGRFVVPLTGVDPWAVDDEVRGDTTLMDSSWTTCTPVYFGDPVASTDRQSIPLTRDIARPHPLHDPDSLQGIVEAVDPTDTADPNRPIAAFAGAFEEFPVDALYLLSGRKMTDILHQTDGACIEVTMAYEETVVTQHAGCMDGRRGGDPVDEIWTIEIEGDTTPDELERHDWVGHAPMDVPTSPEEYLDRRRLSEGSTEVLRREIDGRWASVLRYENDDTVAYSLEVLGDRGGGGGFPGEVWNGCHQVQHLDDSELSMVVVGDSSWTVVANGVPIELEDVDGVGIAVVPGRITSPEQIEIQDPSGLAPCTAP